MGGRRGGGCGRGSQRDSLGAAANEDGHVESVDKIDHDGETGRRCAISYDKSLDK